jgi:DNA-binding NtrC family response regulator
LLNGKRILVVDDEPDVVDSIEQFLPMCRVTKACTFEQAKSLLQTDSFHMAILDIMGVNGYELLDLAKERNVISVMVTAHALSPDSLIRSYEKGAAFCIPKEAMSDIPIFLEDVLEAKEKGKHSWWRWLQRFSETYFEKKFGSTWQDKDKEFWEKFKCEVFHLGGVLPLA